MCRSNDCVFVVSVSDFINDVVTDDANGWKNIIFVIKT